MLNSASSSFIQKASAATGSDFELSQSERKPCDNNIQRPKSSMHA